MSLREQPTFAAKRLCVAFSLFARYFRAHLKKIAQIHPFLLRRPRGARGKSQKCDFDFFSGFFGVHEKSFELTKLFSVTLGQPHGHAAMPLTAEVFRGGFPLRRAFQGHTANMRAAFTFPARALRQIGCAGAKAWFCLRRNLKNRANSPFFAAPPVRRKGKKSKV